MQPVPESHDFPAEEEKILALWEKLDAFKTSERRQKEAGKPRYTFYDGPPFATGLPHYGHILAGTIKDTVTRYASQTGHYVERRFGWDCHGLPIEFEIDKELGIKSKDQVLEYGIDNYNEACRGIVMRYSSDWRSIITRLGRWIDFDNDYKTMDPSFMESVWWVFSEMNRKGLVYRGFKVMPYSTGCTTPLSNFEANLNYKDVSDPAVYVSFPLKEDPSVKLVAWTTTPWTLPSNMALCVNPNMEYVKVKEKESGEQYVQSLIRNVQAHVQIIMKKRLVSLYASAKPVDPSAPPKEPVELEYELLDTFPGSSLAGKEYEPLFDYFAGEYAGRAWKVLVDEYVSDESGTGIVHQAPAFGEDDYRVCLRDGVIEKTVLPCPVDDDGRFTKEVTDFSGQYIKEADKGILRLLKDRKRVVKQGTIVHSYPFCWRSETPLIYRTIPSWFVNVEKIKDQIVENNKGTYWVPEFVKEKRFHNWLTDARDWAVSRNRYWGTPLPIWISDDGEEKVVVGSIAELEELSGVTNINDLHRHKIDHITIPSKEGRGDLKRVPEVFDCWFESGSMPYAQQHYPFENKERFEQEMFPAQFIAEGLDQTRGWFYTLMVIGTALFDKAPFQNLVCNGLVLAEDGKKMSKRLKNYPDPMMVVHKYGADSLRLYLIDSPVVRAEPLKFKESGVKDVIKNVFLKWFHAYRLFVQNASRLENYQPNQTLTGVSNVTDKWILASLQSLLKYVQEEMAGYRLYNVVPKLVSFIADFSNWYVRLNRHRLREGDSPEDRQNALDTMFHVLLTLSRAMGPFTPFFAETLYQNLRLLLPESSREESVHYTDFPAPDESLMDPVIERRVSRMQAVIELGRQARDRGKMPVKQRLSDLTVYNVRVSRGLTLSYVQSDQQYLDDVKSLESYVLDELNIQKIVYSKETAGDSVKLTIRPNARVLGKRLNTDAKKVFAALKEMKQEAIAEFEKTKEVVIEGHRLANSEESEDLMVSQEYVGDTKKYQAGWNQEVMVLINLVLTDDLKDDGVFRQVCNRIQKLRKEAGVTVTDELVSFYQLGKGKNLALVTKVLTQFADKIQKQTNTTMKPYVQEEVGDVMAKASGKQVDGIAVTLYLCK